ncbi:predicted protein [Naegleria gruberi]|uniref:Predicted protein n=1 Tax=Naegleria gruberi TaxID=5762 RepID=D2VCA4_NAEGR|nr:uncharacterized protein NAEGRDRAFT_66501 [Naegleria gruberi]EFC45619.1 predicted protein [Naegleria gruberi]|eukprot:XP_002678363.1 predicted protein [Naegleria gruberi strain NEG-M]
MRPLFSIRSDIVRHFSSAIRPFFNSAEKLFREIMKPHLTFEECASLYANTNTKSMSLATLMITLCSKHKRSEVERRKYIDELKNIIHHFDEGSATIRTIDIAISTLVHEEGYDEVVTLVRKLGNSSLASLKSFRLDQILKVLSSYPNDFELDIAKHIFSVLLERKQVSLYAYNYYAQCLFKYNFEEGMTLLHEMNAQKIKIFDNLFISSLTFSLKKNKQKESRMICSMIEHSKTTNKVLLTTMVNFYNKCEDYDKAIEITRNVSSDGLDTTSYNCLIQSYIGKSDLNRAIEMLAEMQQQNISPDSATFTIILTACADSKNYEQGLKVL